MIVYALTVIPDNQVPYLYQVPDAKRNRKGLRDQPRYLAAAHGNEWLGGRCTLLSTQRLAQQSARTYLRWTLLASSC